MPRTTLECRLASPKAGWCLAAILLLPAGAACYGSTGGGDAADDGGADDGAGPARLRIEIVNVSPDHNAFLDACPHCNVAWQLREAAGTALTLPGLLTCRCTSCAASPCTGMTDGPYTWIELPPGATLVFEWDGRRHDFVAGGCTTTGSGCWAPTTAGAGTYELSVSYSLSTESSATSACPGGGVPWELEPFQDVATVARCERTCAGAGCPALALEAEALERFSWPGTATVRVELGGG
jgi:hypothetical protein